MVGFTKLHAKIIHSSIWQENAETCKVWVTMLAMAGRDGVVEASISGLARASNLPIEAVEAALKLFLGPDPYSSDGTTGERIEVVPGGWLLLNHHNYRDLRTKEQIATAERVARHRSKDSVTSIEVTSCNGLKRPPASASESASAFEAFWEAFDRKVSKPDAIRAWKKIDPDADLAAVIIAKAKEWVVATPDKAFRPYPATWLNRRSWEDELPVAPRGKAQRPAEPPRNAMPVAVPPPVIHEPGNPDCQCDRCCAERARGLENLTVPLTSVRKAQ